MARETLQKKDHTLILDCMLTFPNIGQKMQSLRNNTEPLLYYAKINTCKPATLKESFEQQTSLMPEAVIKWPPFLHSQITCSAVNFSAPTVTFLPKQREGWCPSPTRTKKSQHKCKDWQRRRTRHGTSAKETLQHTSWAAGTQTNSQKGKTGWEFILDAK